MHAGGAAARARAGRAHGERKSAADDSKRRPTPEQPSREASSRWSASARRPRATAASASTPSSGSPLDRRRAASMRATPYGRPSVDGPARHDRGRRPASARGGVGPAGRGRLRSGGKSRVPARGNGDRGLRGPAEDGDRRARRRERRCGRGALRRPAGACLPGSDPRRRDGEVRGQRLPRDEDRVRERDRRTVRAPSRSTHTRSWRRSSPTAS